MSMLGPSVTGWGLSAESVWEFTIKYGLESVRVLPEMFPRNLFCVAFNHLFTEARCHFETRLGTQIALNATGRNSYESSIDSSALILRQIVWRSELWMSRHVHTCVCSLFTTRLHLVERFYQDSDRGHQASQADRLTPVS